MSAYPPASAGDPITDASLLPNGTAGTATGIPSSATGCLQPRSIPDGSRRAYGNGRPRNNALEVGNPLPAASHGFPGMSGYDADAFLVRGARFSRQPSHEAVRNFYPSGYSTFPSHAEMGLSQRQLQARYRPPFSTPHLIGTPPSEAAHNAMTSAVGSSLSQWYEMQYGRGKEFPQLDVGARSSRMDDMGRACSDQSMNLHFDLSCDRVYTAAHEADFARLASGREQRRYDSANDSSANPLFQLWWGQFSGGGALDDCVVGGVAQQEWNGAASRWQAGQVVTREDCGASHRFWSQQHRGYPAAPVRAELAALLGPFGAPPVGSVSEPNAPDSIGGGSTGNHLRRPSAVQVSELSPKGDTTHAELPAALNGPKVKSKRRSRKSSTQNPKPIKPKLGETVFVCYVCHEETDASHMKNYLRNRKICDSCRNADSCLKDGRPVRYCQLCSWIHPVVEFDTGRKSCRTELKRHNERRRNAKKQALQAAAGSSIAS